MQGQEKLVEYVEIKQTGFSNRLLLILVIVLFGIAIGAMLYMHYNFSIQMEKLDSKQANIQSASQQINNAKAEFGQSLHKLAPEHKTIILPAIAEPKQMEIKVESVIYCQDLANFLQQYFQMHKLADQGKEFSKELQNLSHYKLIPEAIAKHLNSLSNMAFQNRSDEYFKTKFNTLIKDLYRYIDSSNDLRHRYFGNYFNHIFFIRAIGAKAKAQGGLSKEIVLIEEALAKNDLVTANEHMKKLPQHLDELKDLQQKLQNKLAINKILEDLDSLISQKIECK